MKNKFLIGTFLILFACEKGEIPIQPHLSGEERVNTIAMGENYNTQLFFSLDQNAVIASNLKTDWDLAFEATDTGWHVHLNTSKGMAASKKSGTFENITDTLGAVWNWDAHTGNMDSTGIGDWQSYGGVYIIDRGYDEAGTHLGFSKIRILSVSSTTYQINYGNLNTTVPISTTIEKNQACGYSYINLTTGGTVSIAPPKTGWDLMFTQYTHIFDGSTPYLVTGVLLNPYNTEACLIDYLDYTAINYELAQTFTYSSNLNAIGYEWKYYNYSEGQYIVHPEMIYVIKTQHDYYYKLHFIDFYNDSGVKGYPEFEFSRL